MLGATERCIYCSNPGTTLEHMPPRTMFREKSRPKGLEFACCTDCNNATSAADLVASFLAKMDFGNDLADWKFQENMFQRWALDRKAPGFMEELLHPDKGHNVMLRTRGILSSHVSIKVDGPLSRAYLNVFSAKMAMALYREHVGEALPIDGIAHTMWFTNAGLTNDMAASMLKMLPGQEELKQGTFTSSGQFGYRYNSDGKSIVAALVGLHQGLHIFLIATGTPNVFPIPNDLMNTQNAMKPGDLVNSMPRVGVLRAGQFRGLR